MDHEVHEVAENESCPCVKAMADGDGDYIKKKKLE